MGRYYARTGSKGQQIVCIKSNHVGKITKGKRGKGMTFEEGVNRVKKNAKQLGKVVPWPIKMAYSLFTHNAGSGMMPYMGGRLGRTSRGRPMRRLMKGAGFFDWIGKFASKLPIIGSLFKSGQAQKMAKAYTKKAANWALDRGSEYVRDQGSRLMDRARDKLSQRFPSFTPLFEEANDLGRRGLRYGVTSGRNWLQDRADRYTDRYVFPEEGYDPYGNGVAAPGKFPSFYSGKGKARFNSPYKKMKVARGIKHLRGRTVPCGGAILSGPIP